jgi:hypothetical protein
LLLRPSQMPGFALVSAALIGRYKPLLRPLMLKSMRPRGLELMSWCLSPWCLMPRSLMLNCRYSAILSLSRHFFLGFGLLCFQEGALRPYMPTETAVMKNRRSSDGMRLLSAWNIIIDLFLLFIFNDWRKLWDCRRHKHSLRGRRNIRRGSYIPETSPVKWALLNGQHTSQLLISDSL